MKVLVTYRSATGNTKKIAEAIFDEITVEKEIRSFREIDKIEGYDFVFVGFPVEKFGAGEASKKWMNEQLNGVKIGLFCTHGAPENAPTVPPWLDSIKADANEAGAEIVAFFNCQGELSQKVLDMMVKAADSAVRRLAEFGRDGTLGQPNESRIEKARVFARETMKKL